MQATEGKVIEPIGSIGAAQVSYEATSRPIFESSCVSSNARFESFFRRSPSAELRKVSRSAKRASMASSSTPSTRSPTQAQAGDKPVNFFQKMKAANGIQRDDGITNRAVVGRALVAALTCEPVDLTMNVEEGLRPVLVEDWAAWFANPTKISGELN